VHAPPPKSSPRRPQSRTDYERDIFLEDSDSDDHFDGDDFRRASVEAAANRGAQRGYSEVDERKLHEAPRRPANDRGRL
jgi:hypothetical protein